MKPKNIPGVPRQFKGSFHDTESIKEVENGEELDIKFDVLKQRFFDINQWRKYCNKNSADFKLCDSSGKIVERLPKIADYIRIDIPGPGGSEGRSYDWVQIIMIDLDIPGRIMIQCRPSKDPIKENSRKIAHFYSNAATSTFIISKEKNILKAGIYGRNEYPNLKSGFFNCIRNIVIAIGGMFGFSKIEWKCLTDGLVDLK
ncbi:hypothetical protein DRF62_11295 [Chryseobacterium piscium]|uniref:Uncharacterized protein n=1 Tax=Chryseobacterium piscium TaxID=333702 RepID=A0A3D9BKE8_9FLAO|nr:hypothetical protein [Chryseobacterium piscium]REC53999.1 hypothetical protein DRF62_11295 [Chryseobacterium piscium]